MESSACEKVFGIPELVQKLTLHMSKGELATLMQTSHRLYILCLAAFYRHMNCHSGRLLNSIDAIQALARNTHHVRSLDVGRSFSTYYFNAVRDFHQLASRTLGLGYYGGRLSAFSCPEWVPAPDPRVCLLVPFPPMTHLTHLTVQIGLDYYQDSYEDETLIDNYETTNHVAQVAWIVHLNPNLVQVCISGIKTKDLDALYALAWSVNGLKKLEKLILEFLGGEGLWAMLSLSFWFVCPRSLKGLGLLFEEDWSDDDDDDDDNVLEDQDKATHADLSKIASWGLQRRQGPLDNLEIMTVEHIADLATNQVCELFQACPSLIHLTLPYLGPGVDVIQVGRAIAKSCTSLTGFISKGSADDHRQVLLFEILENMAVPALKKFVSIGLFPVSDRMMAAFRRHATTLTWVQFDTNGVMENRFIQMVLFECPVLERVVLGDGTGWMITTEPRLTVAQVVERKWASSRIKYLNLGMSLGDLADITDTAEPYYDRPAPIVLTDQEQRQFAVLERFYTQLGAQTELEILELWRIEPVLTTYDNDGEDYSLRDLAFPGLLGLAEPTTGRPGFLALLGGLKRLKSLRGSFSCSCTGENKAIVGMNEVRWIAEAWPALKEAEFLPEMPIVEANPSPCFDWLRQRRPDILLS